jgi:hypothetical protein
MLLMDGIILLSCRLSSSSTDPSVPDMARTSLNRHATTDHR